MAKPFRNRAIVQAYLSGWRQDVIADLHGTSRQNVSRIVRSAGVKEDRRGRPRMAFPDAQTAMQYSKWRAAYGAAMAREMAGLPC